ncbi:MAG: hypothetical protein ACYTGV_17590 [Planctomycetota bacterium]|jgi:hypothetical protein
MLRAIPLLALVVALTACDAPDDASSTDPGLSADPKPEPVSPAGGLPRMRDMYRNLEKIVVKLEGQEKPSAREVEMVLNGIGQLQLAVDRAVKEEARDTVQSNYAEMRKRQAALFAERNTAYDERRQVQEMLKAGKPPPGFTKTEIEDQEKDLTAKIAEIERNLADHNAEMRKLEILRKKEVIPPQGETAFTKELAAVQELKKRAEALRAS